jgi:hypothetical protein
MRSNAGMANGQGDVYLRFVKVDVTPVRNLAWLGLAWLGLAWLGLAWLGLGWLGLGWLGLAWLGPVIGGGWVCLVSSYIGRVISPSETDSCYMKQLIRPIIYACPAWRSAARNNLRGLQVLQSKCLRLATGALWYVRNRQIHEDLRVPLFADHIRALTARFDSKLADGGTLLVRQLGRYADRGLTASPGAKAKGGSCQQASRDHRPRWPSRLNKSPSALISRAPFAYPD